MDRTSRPTDGWSAGHTDGQMYGRMDSRIDQVEEDRASNRDFFPNFFPLSLSVSLPLFFSTLFLRWITQAAKSNSERPILETNSRIEARTFRRETNVFLFFFQPDIFIRARR